jgi:hypothetical protein
MEFNSLNFLKNKSYVIFKFMYIFQEIEDVINSTKNEIIQVFKMYIMWMTVDEFMRQKAWVWP